jgi:RNA polymerase-binding transcription factor DksA
MGKISKKTCQKIKKKLETERALIEKELKSFSREDKKLKGNWDTFFPYFDGEIGSAQLEKAAEEVEEYEARLPVEHTLESRLKNINLALKKIGKDKYGVCERCKKPINLRRLEICPEARLCIDCQKNNIH